MNRKAPTEVRALEVAPLGEVHYIEEANDQYGSSITHTHFHIASQPVTVLPLRLRVCVPESEMIMPRRMATCEPREPTKHRRQKTPLQGSSVRKPERKTRFHGVSFMGERK